jgi:uracil-DNA glycosylase
MTLPQIPNQWQDSLKGEIIKPYFGELMNFLRAEYAEKTIYPQINNIFNALEFTSLRNTKVVILGQDPYHGPGQAHGLCFSVPDGLALPPSLKNIYKELSTDLNIPIPKSGNLSHWAKSGVLLLNSVLTVRENSPGSHANKGWEVFTDFIIQEVSKKNSHCVFMLWGNYARKKKVLIDSMKHLILEAPHPSPLSANQGFLGCGHFSKCDNYLIENGIEPVFKYLYRA